MVRDASSGTASELLAEPATRCPEQIGDAAAVQVLRHLAQHGEARVQRASARALKRLGAA